MMLDLIKPSLDSISEEVADVFFQEATAVRELISTYEVVLFDENYLFRAYLVDNSKLVCVLPFVPNAIYYLPRRVGDVVGTCPYKASYCSNYVEYAFSLAHDQEQEEVLSRAVSYFISQILPQK